MIVGEGGEICYHILKYPRLVTAGSSHFLYYACEEAWAQKETT